MGREYPVSTVDHIYFPPNSRRFIVTDDEGVTVSLPTFYLTGFVQLEPPAVAGEPLLQS